MPKLKKEASYHVAATFTYLHAKFQIRTFIVGEHFLPQLKETFYILINFSTASMSYKNRYIDSIAMATV